MKSFKCRDLEPSCDWQIEAETEQDVLNGAAAHARDQHSDVQFTDEIRENIRKFIQEARPKAA